MPNSSGVILLNSGGQSTRTTGTSSSQATGDRVSVLRSLVLVSGRGRSAMDGLLGVRGGVGAVGPAPPTGEGCGSFTACPANRPVQIDAARDQVSALGVLHP